MKINGEIKEILVSRSFMPISEQSCDCDALIIRTENRLLLLKHADEAIEISEIQSFDGREFPFCVELGDERYTFETVEYNCGGAPEAIAFKYADTHIYVFGGTHNLILTKSKYDLIRCEGDLSHIELERSDNISSLSVAKAYRIHLS